MPVRRYYLGPYQWFVDDSDPESDPSGYWARPVGAVGAIDLAKASSDAIAQDYIAGQERSVGLFVTDDLALGSDYDLIAQSEDSHAGLSKTLSPSQRQAWANVVGLSVTPTGPTLLDCLVQTLGAASIPEEGLNPLMPNSQGSIEIVLGGHSRIWSRQLRSNIVTDPHYPKMKSLLKMQYGRTKRDALAESVAILQSKLADVSSSDRRERVAARRVASFAKAKDISFNKAKVIVARIVQETHLKYLGGLGHKLRMSDDDVASEIGDGNQPKRPGTTYSDDFNDTGETEWTDGSGWWIHTGTELRNRNSTGQPYHYYHTALGYDDMYAEIVRANASSTYRFIGPAVRLSNAAQTYYYCYGRDNGTPRRVLGKQVSGSNTALDSDSTNLGTSPNANQQVRADGSTIEAFYNSTADPPTGATFSETDTAITGLLYSGVMAQGTDNVYGDDWSVTDIASGGGSSTFDYRHGRTRYGSAFGVGRHNAGRIGA